MRKNRDMKRTELGMKKRRDNYGWGKARTGEDRVEVEETERLIVVGRSGD